MKEEQERGGSAPASEQVLLEDGPVAMPELPSRMHLNSSQHFKAVGDPLRLRILGIIQHQPATAKQIAARLKTAPGTIGHHLQVLEGAGLVQVVARRLVHGIVAKYYTRTARLFTFDFPPEVTGNTSISLNMLTRARDEMAEVLTGGEEAAIECTSFPLARLSTERMRVYRERLMALVDDFAREPPNPEGQVYRLCTALFQGPSYLQTFGETDAMADTAPEDIIPTQDQ